MMTDLESLRCFAAAASHLSFRVASRSIGLSPAAFSDRIKRLEEELGVGLFARTTRHVALTPAGVRLVPLAREIMAATARCASVARADDVPVPYELVLGTRFELGLSWLTVALDALGRAVPHRTLHLVFSDTPDLVARVKQGLIDAAVTSARLAQAGLAYETLHDEDYAFVGATSLLRRRPLVRASDALEHVLLDTTAELPLFRYFLDAGGRGQSWSFARNQYLGTIGAIRLRVLASAGVAVLPRYFVERDLASGRLTRILPRARLQRDAFRLIWRAGHPRNLELRRLAAELAAIPLA